MTIDAQLGVVREIRAKLEEEGAEIFVDAVEVELVDRRGTLDDPGVFLAVGGGAFLGAKDGRFFLSLAEKQDAFFFGKAATIHGGNVVLAFALLEVHDGNGVPLNERLDLAQE